MLLQKTGWRIKQLISHRKNNDFESRSHTPEELFIQGKPQAGAAKRVSWTSRSPTNGNVEFPLLRRTSSTATTKGRNPPPISKSTHSSASSLCSCCDANLGANRPLSQEHLHPGCLCSLPPTLKKNSEDTKTQRLEHLDQRSTPSLTKLDTNFSSTISITTASSATFDLLEACSIDPVDEGKTPTQILGRPDGTRPEDMPNNVEQLIRETDEAFLAVGIALADAKTATEGWYDTEPNIKGVRKSRTLALPIKVSMTRSLSSPKRRKSVKKKKTLLGRTIRAVPPPPTNSPRWTLMDVKTNVVDVFSGKIFRMDVDEMLTEVRLQQLRSESQLKLANESRISVDSTQSVDTEESTPTDPFHFESLSNRIAASQKPEKIPIPSRPPPHLPETEKLTFFPRSKHQAETGMEFQTLKFPAPPRPPRRSTTSRSSPLPTILEASPFPPRESVLLPSTHFTLTSPLFRHGPIRVERIIREPKESPEEEPLDWTAFQMAISGTMDDGLGGGNDWEVDELGMEDIVEWWKGFGFQGWGKMERCAQITQSSRKGATKPKRRKSKVPRDIACPLPIRSLKPLPMLREAMIGRDNNRAETDTSKILSAKESRKPGGFANTSQNRSSMAESLPPSPMLDLVLPSPSKDDEVIPMGFNLGHDLGDFLSWEARHVQTLFIDD